MLEGIVRTPVEQDDEWDVYYTYTVQAKRRDELKIFLEQKGIETKIQHPILMPAQPAYRDNVWGDFENAERLVQQILSIPANEKITYEDVKYVAANIRDFYQS
jgi:dTDP-4-amino-4,6-dideoxygalactose transaminase